MTKDRLKALQSVVQENEEAQEEEYGNGGLYNTAIDIEDENAGYMQHFFSEIVQIRDWINDINENVAAVKLLHSRLLSSPRPDEAMKQELQSRSDHVNQLGKKVNANLKALERGIIQEEDEIGSEARLPAGLRIRKTQHSTTLHLFVEAITQFNKVQVDYKEKSEERMQRVISIAKAEITDEKLEELLEQGNYGSIFNGDIITETLEVRRALEDVQIRHQELLKLEKSIQELRDLFVEMYTLVEHQGDLVNRIENNVQQAGKDVEIAKKETKRAIHYKDKARLKKIIILVLLAVLLLVVILVALNWPKSSS